MDDPRLMKLCVLTSYDRIYIPVREITGPVNQKYCESHGYEFLIHPCEKKTWPEKVWEKIPLLLENLAYYDWVMWLDSDAIIMNHSIRLERIISMVQDWDDLIISCDEHGLNSAVFLIRNSGWSHEFLKRVDAKKDEYLSHRYPEQEAMESEAFIPGEGHVAANMPAWLLNEFWCTWMPGDFIVHHAGGSVEDKVKGLTPFLEKVRYV
jgi:hypothetical protein